MSLLKISNKALRKLAVTEVISLSQQGKAAARCSAAVEDIVLEVLRAHNWGFAMVWESLAQLATGPPFGYDYAYQLPVEFIKLADIRQSEDLKAPAMDWDIARGNIVYTDADPCYARYVVYFEADLGRAPADFIDACAWKLAAEIALPLAKSMIVDGLLSGYKYAIELAKLSDAADVNEREEDENRNNSILAARRYPGYVGDYPYEEI